MIRDLLYIAAHRNLARSLLPFAIAEACAACSEVSLL